MKAAWTLLSAKSQCMQAAYCCAVMLSLTILAGMAINTASRISVQNAYEVDTACAGDCVCPGVPNRSLARNSTAYSCYATSSSSLAINFIPQVGPGSQ